MRGWIRRGRAKRCLDLVVSVPALLVAVPGLAAIAAAVRLSSGAPVIFRQDRAGRTGKVFRIVKFRTMEGGRPTRFGALLRATRLDELPQLWNVVVGDMSLVGPRPLHARYVVLYDKQQRRRLEARPGLTGWAEIHGGRTLPWPERFELDIWYVDHASLWLDARILAATVWRIVRDRSRDDPDDARTTPEFTGS